MPFRNFSFDAFLVLLQPFWSVPLGFLVLWTLCLFARSLCRGMFLKWKLVVTSEELKYVFGIFRKTTRKLPLANDLRFCPRNGWRKKNDFDPSNPAISELHAVVIRVGNDYFGELPCSDSDEVRRICVLLADFVALKERTEIMESDRIVLVPYPEFEKE